MGSVREIKLTFVNPSEHDLVLTRIICDKPVLFLKLIKYSLLLHYFKPHLQFSW